MKNSIILPSKEGVNILTFPGIIVHEIAHRFFCDLFEIPVYKVVYFNIDSGKGYVIHHKPTTIWQAFWITVAPFFINSLLCIFLCIPLWPMFEFSSFDDGDYTALALIWLGVSIGMHAFPSNEDFNHLLLELERTRRKWLYGWIYLLAYFFKLMNLLSVFGINAVYAVFIGISFSRLFFLCTSL